MSVQDDLLAASLRGNLQIIRDILSQGIDPNIRNQAGFTPLILAINSGKKESVELLLENGADPNMRDAMLSQQFVPMKYAIDNALSTGKTDILKLLIKQRVDLDLPLKNNYVTTVRDFLRPFPDIIREIQISEISQINGMVNEKHDDWLDTETIESLIKYRGKGPDKKSRRKKTRRKKSRCHSHRI